MRMLLLEGGHVCKRGHPVCLGGPENPADHVETTCNLNGETVLLHNCVFGLELEF